MNSISWEHFDGTSFQKFCNALLMMEVSKLAFVYSAAGKDNGIDQFYNGGYAGKIGKWRFQDKFHNTGNPKTDATSFKRDIIEDIKNHYDGEDIIVFICNVNLGNDKFNELENAAYETLRELGVKKCDVVIWHHASIEALLTNHPLIYSWFWEKDTVLLEPYKEYFAKQINPANNSIRYQLKNTFYGRQEDLKIMQNFLLQDNQSTMAIIANGGYGKTRLCIELFKTLMLTDEEWIPLVLSATGFNPTHFKHLLKGQQRFLILLDNANEVPHIIPDLKRIIDNTNGRCKLILTARKAMISDALGTLNSISNDVYIHELLQLSYIETKHFFEQELPDLSKNQIIYLTKESKGVPNLVLEIVNAIIKGKQPYELSADNFFADNVKKIISEIASDIEKHTAIQKKHILEFIKLLTIISPISNTDITLEFISSLIGLRQDDVELLISELSKHGLLDSHRGLAIKPDPYSDAILVDTMKNNITFIKLVTKHKGVGSYFENILKNLAEANLAETAKTFFVDGLLNAYVDELLNSNLAQEKFKSILELTYDITLVKPQIALKATENFIVILNNKQHPYHTTLEQYLGKTLVETGAKKIKQILEDAFKTNEIQNDLPYAHGLVEKYIYASEDYDIIKACYDYRMSDFKVQGYGNPEVCCVKQSFLKEMISRYFMGSPEPQQLRVAVYGCKSLMAIETKQESFYEEATGQITMTKATVPGCSHVEDIRRGILELIISYVQNGKDRETRSTLIEFLAFQTIYCLKIHSNISPLIEKELPDILDLLKWVVKNKPFILDRITILEEMKFLNEDRIKEEYIDAINEIKLLAISVDTAFEHLELFLWRKRYIDNEMDFRLKFIPILNMYPSLKHLLDDVVKIRLNSKYQQTNSFTQLLNFISFNYPDDARCFFELIKTQHPNLIATMATVIRDSHTDDNYFYTQLDYLEHLSPQYDDTIIWLLTYGKRSTEHIKAVDFDYIQRIIDRGQTGSLMDFINFSVAFIKADSLRAFHLINQTFPLLNENDKALFVHHFFIFNKDDHKDWGNELKAFIFDNIALLPIDNYTFDKIPLFLEKNFGFDIAFDYVLQKVKSALYGDEYKWLSLNEHQFLDDAELDTIGRFEKVLDWFINNEIEHKKVANYLLNLYRPNYGFNDKIASIFSSKLDQSKDHLVVLLKLCEAIKVFGRNKLMVTSFCKIAESCLTHQDYNVSYDHDIFDYGLYNSSGGMKVGRGVPFPEDVARKNVLDSVISENDWSPRVKLFLYKSLEKVQRDIGREIASDGDGTLW